MRNNATYYKKLVAFNAVILVGVLLSSTLAHSESASKLKLREDKIREEMIVISRQLGVTCNECHNPQNFVSDEKKNFKIGKDHIRIVETLRKGGFDGKKGPEASCYMCHQGKLRPEYKETLGK